MSVFDDLTEDQAAAVFRELGDAGMLNRAVAQLKTEEAA